MPTKSIAQIVASVAKEELGLIKACDLIEAKLQEEGLSYTSQINPRMVGLDPCNRDGIGANVQEILPLAHSIAFAGFNWKLCSHAVCVEVCPNSSEVEAFNIKLASSGHLAPVEPYSIKFSSLACGHNNMGLRAIAASMPTDSHLLGRNGNCDLEHLRSRDPEYGLAVDNGLHWLVLRAEVRTKYPEVLSVIQVCRWDMWFLFMSAYPFTLTRPRPKNTPISRYTLARWYTRHIWKGTSTHVRPVIILACVTIFDTHTLAIFSRRTSVRKFLMFMSWAPFLLRTYADVCVSLGICLRDGAGLGKQSPRQTYVCVRVTLPCSLHFSELPDQHACARVLAGGFGISAMASLFVWLPYHV